MVADPLSMKLPLDCFAVCLWVVISIFRMMDNPHSKERNPDNGDEKRCAIEYARCLFPCRKGKGPFLNVIENNYY